MAKQCVVNRDANGKVTSVEVQNLDISTDYSSYIDNFLSTVKNTELFREVTRFKEDYIKAVDDYINSKESDLQIMRDLEIPTRTLFYDSLAELNVPIKLPLTQELYETIMNELANGATKKTIISKYKINGYSYKYLSRNSPVILTGSIETRESTRSRELPEEIANSIIADRESGMSIIDLYAKYPYPMSTINSLLKLRDKYFIKTEAGIVRNIYSNSKRGIPYQSEKLNRWLMADSNYEIARFIELDNDPTVLSYTRDVEPIPYEEAGKNRGYYPDIQVTYTDGRIEIEEIKPFYIISTGEKIRQMRLQGMSEDDIRHELNLSKTMYNIVAKNILKIDTANKYYEELGVTFKVLTENEINVKLSDYSSLTKMSTKDKREFRKEQKGLELKEKEFLNSQLYDELKQQPFIDEDQALDAYKNIYSDDLNQWKNEDLDC